MFEYQTRTKPREDQTTSLVFKTEHGTYTIEVNAIEMTIEQVMLDLVAPVLLAAGYNHESINDYITIS